MNKVIKLENSLVRALSTADEIWVAVALMSEYGLEVLQKNTKEECIQNILVGISLPTSIQVLRKLKQKSELESINTRVFTLDKFFHPKLYVVKRNDSFTAFLGSANCTKGGLSSNIELNFKTNEKDFCMDLIHSYFEKYFSLAVEIDDVFLKKYEAIYRKRAKKFKEDQIEIQKLLTNSIEESKLELIDFRDQFFKYEHYDAFTPKKSISESADIERTKVGDRLIELDELLWPRIRKKGWDIHKHPNKQHQHSTTELSIARALYISKLKSVWLHYGKKKKELAYYKELGGEFPQTFIHHVRLQVIVKNTSMGVWLVIGKNNGSYFDRNHFNERMKSSLAYRKKFFKLIKSLGVDFSIYVNGEKKNPSDFKNEKQLWSFVKQDNQNHYFMMCKDYFPGDPKISKQNIVDTIIDDFEKLIPIYSLIKHRIESNS